MMKYVKWISGIALVPAAVAVALVATAAPGDKVYPKRAPETKLTGAQKTCVASWVKGVWPEAVKAKLQTLTCERVERGVTCSAVEERSVSRSAFVDADKASRVGEVCEVTDDSGTVTYCHQLGPALLDASQKSGIKACAGLIWPGSDTGEIIRLAMQKNGSGRLATYHYLTTGTEAEYVADRVAGVADPLVGEVAE